ncbi:MAG: undecaprenyl-diphosphate phosphatase [Candidatus Roizmanbacteria bacterium]|nr:undecaprenyl-diphosphate phosphatase [Candidatus Roizmanbacteria bacterium]
MTIVQSAILGVVEGITEFLPISSTFHLILASTFLRLTQSEFVKLFEIFIQSGAILAVIFLYYKEVMRDRVLFVKLIVSFLPTAVVGIGLYKIIKEVFFERIDVTTITFIIVGIIFLIVEYGIQKKWLKIDKNMSKLSYKQAILVGLLQSFAVLPGVSRAGAVIVGMMMLGYKRSEAAKYSFMLSVPTILAAALYDFYKMREFASENSDELLLLSVGFIVAFASAYIGVKWLIKYLQNNSLTLFGWYRIVVGILLFISR